MKKIFLISLTALCFVTTGCNKKDGTTYPVPTENKTYVDTENYKVVRTQVVKDGKQAVEITYFFDENIKYNHQEWKVIFSTEAGANTLGIAATLYYALKQVNVSYDANIVSINYPFGEGLGDDKLALVNTLAEVEGVVAIAEILEILGLF